MKPIHTTRRRFLKNTGMGLASLGVTGALLKSLLAAEKSNLKTDPPEISASVFPCDVADEGMGTVFDNLQNLACVNSAYLCNLDQSKRPFRGGKYPHNPVRKSFATQGSRIYWNPNMKLYGRIKPLLSTVDFLAGTDWVDAFVKECRKRKMKAGVEFFHGYIDSERLNGSLKDLRQLDVFGNTVKSHNHGMPASCLNNPDFQEFVVALYFDVISHYDLDYVQTCMMPFVLPARLLVENSRKDSLEWLLIGPQKGGCFCTHCMKAAAADGFDLKEAQQELQVLAKQDVQAIMSSGISGQDYQDKHPVLKKWFDFRCVSVNRLYGKIKAEAKKCNPKIDLRWNNYLRTHGYYSGVHLPDFMKYIDSIRANVYVEHQNDPKLVAVKVDYLKWFNKVVNDRVQWIAALDIRGKNRDILEQCAELCSYTGCDGYALGHYGGALLENLKAVKRGLMKSKWAQHFD